VKYELKVELTEKETLGIVEAYRNILRPVLEGLVALAQGLTALSSTSAEPAPSVTDTPPVPTEAKPLTEADKQALDALAGMGIRPVADYPPPSDILKKHFDNLGKLTPEQESGALAAFIMFIEQWLVGWEVEGAEQPDRVVLMEHLGSGAHARHILILAYQRLSLQALIIDALAHGTVPGWKEAFCAQVEHLDRVDRLAGHLVQLAAPCGFPELVDTYDYTTRWRRTT
jgi:hypothetical protein